MSDKISDIGVLIGRFQIDKLHEGHISLLDHVTKRHNKVIAFLGVAKGEHKEDQALEYAVREKMIKSAYPQIITIPIQDINDDYIWSKNQYDYDFDGDRIEPRDWCTSGFKHLSNNSISDRNDNEIDSIIDQLKSTKIYY